MLLPRMAPCFCDDGVERVAEQAAGATIETADIFPVPCLPEVALHELHVAPVVELRDGYRLGREAAVGVRDNKGAPILSTLPTSRSTSTGRVR